MTTDRTQPARPPALNDRSSASPAERRDGSVFAALLDAHVPAPADRREPPQARGPEPRDAGVRRDEPRAAATGHEAADQHAAAPAPAETASQPSPKSAAPPAPAAQPAVVPPFVATVPAEAPATPAAQAPAAQAPIFMLAPEAVPAAIAPVAPQPAAPAEPTTPVAALPLPGAPAAPTAASPAAAQPAEAAPTAPAPLAAAPAQAPPAGRRPEPQAPHTQAPAAAERAAEAPAAPEAPAAAAPARAAHAPEATPAPVAAAAAQAPAAGPIAPAAASGPVAPERTVPMHRAPAAVTTLLHVAAERGITHARMALRPVELGGIEIRLQASAAGIAAQVVADSPEAARLLAQAGDDLRRALEARDVNLISLEVSTSGEQRQDQSARGEWSDARDADPTFPGRAAGGAEGDAEPAPTTQSVIELPGGLLVDVLA